MNWLTFSAIGTLFITTYLSALILAIHRKRRSAIRQRFDETNREALGESLTEHRIEIVLALTFFRTLGRVSFVGLVFFDVIDLTNATDITATHVVWSAVMSVIALWLATSVLALAIAEHAGVGLIVRSATLLRVMALIGTPLAKALHVIDEGVRRLSGAEPSENRMEDELLRSIEDTHLEGGLDPEAAEMLENVVEFRSAEVSEIMTPRTDIEGIQFTNQLSEIREFISKAGHSRIPVFDDNLDNIVGILYVKDLVDYLGEDATDFQLDSVLRKPIVVPETKPVPQLLADFQRSEVHLAIVIDEYGGTAGLVTIEDVLEEIVGEIHDEHEPDDDEEPQLTEVNDRKAEVDGRFHIDDLNEQLGLDLPEDADFDTIAGFVLSELGRVPSPGDSFESHNARFTTIEASETHIQRVGVELLHDQHQSSNGSAGSG